MDQKAVDEIVTYHVSTPLQTSKEDDEPGDTQESPNKVDSVNDFPPAQTQRVDSGRRLIEENRDQKTESIPCPTECADVAPVAVVSNELSPQH